MRGTRVAAAAFALGTFCADAAQGTILTFDLPLPPEEGVEFSDAYGDRVSGLSDGTGSYGMGTAFTPNIVVDYRTLSPGGGSGGTLSPRLSFWGPGFPGVTNVAYPRDPTSTGEISFVPDPGYRVVLNEFDISWWPGNQADIPITYYDGSYQMIDSASVARPSAGWTTIAPNLVEAGTLRVQFGNSFDHAINDVDFDQQPARVLVIVLDDVGVDLIAAYDQEYGGAPHPLAGIAPNIELLAAEGVRFRNAWASPSCIISRVSMLTGRHAFRRFEALGPLDESEVPIPEELPSNTKSAAFGKWHVSNVRPTDSGFDVFRGTPRNLGESLPPSLKNYYSWERLDDVKGAPESTTNPYEVYATTDTVDDAITWLEQENGPWVVWLAPNAPHVPLNTPPACLLHTDPTDSTLVGGARVLQALDTELGWLLFGNPIGTCNGNGLDAAHDHEGWQGVDFASTTVILIGDNGSAQAFTGPGKINKGVKGSIHEGGINVPLIVRGHGVNPPQLPATSDALVHAVDVFATVLDLVGVEWQTAGAEPPKKMDSRSLVPFLTSPDDGPGCTDDGNRACARETVYTDGLGYDDPIDKRDIAIRDAQFKLIRTRDGLCEFYDLETHPSESHDLETNQVLERNQPEFDDLRTRLEALTVSTVTCEFVPPPGGGGGCGLLGPELVILVPVLRCMRRRVKCG